MCIFSTRSITELMFSPLVFLKRSKEKIVSSRGMTSNRNLRSVESSSTTAKRKEILQKMLNPQWERELPQPWRLLASNPAGPVPYVASTTSVTRPSGPPSVNLGTHGVSGGTACQQAWCLLSSPTKHQFSISSASFSLSSQYHL